MRNIEFLEVPIRYWSDKEFINDVKRYLEEYAEEHNFKLEDLGILKIKGGFAY